MFIIPTDHWSSSKVGGYKPPPLINFTLSKIADDKVLMFGGNTPQGPSSELTLATVINDFVVSAYVL